MLPVETPVTTPVLVLMEAIQLAALLQVPPLDASVKVDVEPTHKTEGIPPIAAGDGLTVKPAVTKEDPNV